MDERTLARFFSKVIKDGPLSDNRPELGPCWLWKPTASVGGYGQFYLNGRPRLAHRAAWELLVGPIPAGLTIDHLCRRRNCVNPAHLEPVTLAVNLQRSETWRNAGEGSYNRNKTHCRFGHPYSGDNLSVRPNGKRVCKACAREQQARYREARRAAAPPKVKPPRETCKHGHPWTKFVIQRGGKQVCAECERDKVRRHRAKVKAQQPPKPPRETCKHGHLWVPENIYLDPRGLRFCRKCHNEQSLARYYEIKADRDAARMSEC